MQRLFALVLAPLLLVTACGRGERDTGAAQGAPSATDQGTDALVLRVPRRGGLPRVTAYPNIDSTVWSASDNAAALDRVLSFDDDAGVLAFIDGRGFPGWIDFRMGSVTSASHAKLHGVSSLDATSIFAIGADGAVARFTPAGNWLLKPPRPVRSVFPQRDGSLLMLAAAPEGSRLWRVHPPGTDIVDTLELPSVDRALSTQLSDRLYFVTSDHALIDVRTRRLQRGSAISLRGHPVALAATPSDDRLFVATDSSRELSVIDPYRDRIAARITLPGDPADLRMDPFGRYLLVRAAKSDSVWVVAIGTARLIGTTHSAWRGDLPLVMPDGAVALAQGKDVVLLDGETFRPKRRVIDGAADFWYAFQWSGFRPRAAGLDQPVQFGQRDTTDTSATAPAPAPAESTKTAPPARDTVVAAPKPAPRGFVVQFAALLSESAARARASQIRSGSLTARVEPSQREGVTIYRVILGPYPTKDDADRAGRASGQSYWVYQEGQ